MKRKKRHFFRNIMPEQNVCDIVISARFKFESAEKRSFFQLEAGYVLRYLTENLFNIMYDHAIMPRTIEWYKIFFADFDTEERPARAVKNTSTFTTSFPVPFFDSVTNAKLYFGDFVPNVYYTSATKQKEATVYAAWITSFFYSLNVDHKHESRSNYSRKQNG